MVAASRAPYLFGRAAYERARIAALLGDGAGAVKLLRTALEQRLRAWVSAGLGGDIDPHTSVDFESLGDDPGAPRAAQPQGASAQRPSEWLPAGHSDNANPVSRDAPLISV